MPFDFSPRPVAQGRPALNRASPHAKGLVAWWPFHERGGTVLHDLSGRARHADHSASNAGQKWATATEPNIGWALDFNGFTDHLDAGDDFGAGPDFCVLFWATSKANSDFFVSKATSTSYDWGCFRSSAQRPTMFWGANQNVQATTLTIPPTDTWLAMAFCIQRDRQVRFHVGDQVEVMAVSASATNTAGRRLIIGGRWDGASVSFEHNGRMAELRLYDHDPGEQRIAEMLSEAGRWDLYLDPRPRSVALSGQPAPPSGAAVGHGLLRGPKLGRVRLVA